ncbi:RNA polymerase sigma-70 factor [Olivibacter ginsenosidimutans]|uniref:RNA polymerase sigma-70 factor n=1 Tax=Olivibacter ginsenosidimutans TaxID=1176537 RepID=A0ABP9AHB9_9SPHI
MTLTGATAESERLARLKAGDQSAFEWFYHQYKYPLAANLLKLVKSEEVAEDILHDLFLKIWEGREHIDINRSFKAYLYRIATNMVTDFYRKVSRNKAYQQFLEKNSSNSYLHIDELIDQKQKQELMEKALNELSPQCQLVFKLCKLEGRSYEEVSQMLQISPNTISNHLVKASKKVKAFFANPINASYLVLLFLLD